MTKTQTITVTNGNGQVLTHSKPFKPYIVPLHVTKNSDKGGLGTSELYLSSRGVRTAKRVRVWQTLIEKSKSVINDARSAISLTNSYLKGSRAPLAISIHSAETQPMYTEIDNQRHEIARAMGRIRAELEVLHDDDPRGALPMVYPSTPIPTADQQLSQVIQRVSEFSIGGVSDVGYDYEKSLIKRQELSRRDPRNRPRI